MAINYDHVMGLREILDIRYTERDTMLYALSVGFGRAFTAPQELSFVFEKGGLKAAPTMVCVLTRGVRIMEESGVDMTMTVHGGQRIELFAELPPAGALTSTRRVKAVIDKGEGRGAILVIEALLTDKEGRRLAATTSTVFCRADGGFGGPNDGTPVRHPLPEGPPDLVLPDLVLEIGTRPEQALLYRLTGDYNPIHADPALAARAGFALPVLHGLCTYGMVGRLLLHHCCDYDVARFRAMDARFASPVYPGETLVTEIWGKGRTRAFRTSVKERNKVVLDNGLAEFN